MKRNGFSLSGHVFGKEVRVRITTKHRYGRSTGRVFSDSKDINAAMVRSGFAWWYRDYAKTDEALKNAEASAKAENVGLWSDPEPQAPWEFRRDKRT